MRFQLRPEENRIASRMYRRTDYEGFETPPRTVPISGRPAYPTPSAGSPDGLLGRLAPLIIDINRKIWIIHSELPDLLAGLQTVCYWHGGGGTDAPTGSAAYFIRLSGTHY